MNFLLYCSLQHLNFVLYCSLQANAYLRVVYSSFQLQRCIFEFEIFWTVYGDLPTSCTKFLKIIYTHELHKVFSLLKVQLFLKDSWLSALRSAIRSSLSEAGKGWFNLNESIWEVYKISKLAKFMQLVNFAMQVNIIQVRIFLIYRIHCSLGYRGRVFNL